MMKPDFELLEQIVADGASGTVILTMWKAHEAKRDVRRTADRKRKGAENGGTKRKRAEKSGTKTNADAAADRDAATLTDTPRARLFREAKPALLTLGISDSRAGGLVVQWLKLTNDDDQLVLATILRAQSLCVADAPGWILATLKGKTNERAGQGDQSRTATIVSGVAAAAERRFGGGGQPGMARQAEPAGESDPQLFRDG